MRRNLRLSLPQPELEVPDPPAPARDGHPEIEPEPLVESDAAERDERGRRGRHVR